MASNKNNSCQTSHKKKAVLSYALFPESSTAQEAEVLMKVTRLVETPPYSKLANGVLMKVKR